MNKIKISTTKISLINNIGTPPNYHSKYTLAIEYLVTSIHLAKQSTPTMDPFIISKYMKSRLPYGSAIESPL